MGSIFQKKTSLAASHGSLVCGPWPVSGAFGQNALGLMSQYCPVVPAWTWWIFGSMLTVLFRVALSTLVLELPPVVWFCQLLSCQLLLLQLLLHAVPCSDVVFVPV